MKWDFVTNPEPSHTAAGTSGLVRAAISLECFLNASVGT
jgi:hypothetical protein